MSNHVIYLSNNVKDYSNELKKLISDISDELNNEIKDGFAYRLASVENDEGKAYSFMKNEGYDITYKEFSQFIIDCKGMIKENEEFLDEISSEQICEEISDSDLEKVSGGSGWWKNNWKNLAIGVGGALVVGALMVATCGLAAPASVVAGAGFAAMNVLSVHAGLAAGCALAAAAGAGVLGVGLSS